MPKIKIYYLYIIVILLALISSYYNINILIMIAQIISNSFVKIFKCLSLPIISLSIIVTLAKIKDDNQIKLMWKKTILYTISTTLIAANVACLLYYLIAPKNIAINLHAHIPVKQEYSYLKYVDSIIPTNIFSPFIEHQVMGVFVLSIIIGLAISCIEQEQTRHSILQVIKGLHSIFMKITSWVVKLIPLALFGFLTTTLVQLNQGLNIRGLTQYLLVIIVANAIQGFIILPIFLRINKIKNPFKMMHKMLPALSMAFFSKSSAGTLPITIKTIENNLQVSPKVSRFVLPLCTSINMNACAAFIFTTVIYLLQNNGAHFSYLSMLVWTIISTIVAIGNAGVPMGCFFLATSLLSCMNVPIEILGLILPFYSLIDMEETALNVWSDSCITKVIATKVEG